MAARSFMGAGDIYINRMVDGVEQGMIGPIDNAMGQRVSLLARRPITHDGGMGHVVVGFRLDDQYITGKFRAGMQGPVGLGVYQRIAVIH